MARSFGEIQRRGHAVVTGDGFAKLAAWRKLFEATPELLEAISVSGAEEMISLVKDGFRDETDPYGKKWARKKKKNGRKILSGKTSRLKGGWHYKRADKGGFTISPSVDYAAYHQTGTRRMVARKMVPDSRGLPREWSKKLEEVAKEALEQHFTTGGGGKAGGGMGFLTARIAGIKRQLNIKSLIRKLANAASEE
jgi:phage gpG-like protein